MSNQFAQPVVFSNSPFAQPVIGYDADGNPLAFESLDALRLAGEGLVADTFPRSMSIGTTIMLNGVAWYAPIQLREGQVLTNAHIIVNVAGASVTFAKVGLYSPALALLAATGNLTTAWESTGTKTHALTAPYTVPASGTYWVAVLAVSAVTMPTIYRAGVGSTAAQSIGGNKLAWALQTSLADLPNPAVPAAGGAAPWVGFS